MPFRISTLFLGVALALSITAIALAQSDGDPSMTDEPQSPATAIVPEAVSQTLFLRVLDPADQEVEVPLARTTLTVYGVTLAGAVVSVDGELADVDDQGNFFSTTPLDEGANEIDVVASDSQGNQVSTTLFVSRGD